MTFCEHCPRRYDTALPGKPGACSSGGDNDAPILVIGECPGEHELGSTPFQGKAGALLWGAGRAAGLSRADCRIVNVCNCWPIGNKGRDLSEQQIGACWGRFNADIEASRAKVIICLGGDALTRITGLTKIDRYRGFVFTPDMLRSQTLPMPVLGAYKTSSKCKACLGTGSVQYANPEEGYDFTCVDCKGTGYKFRKGDERLLREKLEIIPVLPASVQYIVAAYHPGYVAKMGRKPLRAFINDLGRAVRASQGKLEFADRHWSDTPIEVCRTGEANMVAFDIENMGGLEGSIERIGLSGPHGTWTGQWNSKTREATRFELGDPDRIKIAHNLQHDLKHLEADGVEVPGKVFDTMWAGMVLEPDLPMGLRSMAPLWLDLHGCWKDEMRNDPAYYNAMDAAITRDLAQSLILRHKDIGSYDPLMKFVMPALRTLLDMNRQGMQVDLAWMGAWSRRLSARGMRIEKVWRENCPIECDIASPLKVQMLLYGYCGMEVIKDPDNGYRPTTAAWAIQVLIARYPEFNGLLRCLLSYRKIEKLLSCCSISLGADGAVHPHFGPHWKDEQSEGSKRKGTTSTLRLSVAAEGGLNLQQIPKMARRMYVPPSGFVFLEVDLDRAEPWIYAVRANDPVLINELENGDPYLRVAADAGCDRSTAKILFLARTYGAGAKKGRMILAKRGIDASPQTVNRVFASMTSLYARTESYRNSIGRRAVTEGRLTSGFGFVRNFLGGDADVTEAQDWEAQHHVAVTLLSLLPPLQTLARSFGGHLALTVYDSALLCVPREKAEAAGKAMLEVMRTERPEIAPGFRPRCSEVKMGTNWRDLR